MVTAARRVSDRLISCLLSRLALFEIIISYKSSRCEQRRRRRLHVENAIVVVVVCCRPSVRSLFYFFLSGSRPVVARTTRETRKTRARPLVVVASGIRLFADRSGHIRKCLVIFRARLVDSFSRLRARVSPCSAAACRRGGYARSLSVERNPRLKRTPFFARKLFSSVSRLSRTQTAAMDWKTVIRGQLESRNAKETASYQNLINFCECPVRRARRFFTSSRNWRCFLGIFKNPPSFRFCFSCPPQTTSFMTVPSCCERRTFSSSRKSSAVTPPAIPYCLKRYRPWNRNYSCNKKS